jgi:peroxiredoxin Q/BCP
MSAAKKTSATVSTTSPVPIAAGVVAPDFQLPDDAGTPRRLSEFRGQPVVLYFYPADDTSGCTKEACGFRDDFTIYRKHGFVILGVSPDSAESHTKFKRKYDLPFPLLADVGHKVCSMYGVWGPKQFMGRTYDGVLRTTFLIDRSGKIGHVFERVRPGQHTAEVLEALKSM